jgi:PPOX class probable F420-dependent enzyme
MRSHARSADLDDAGIILAVMASPKRDRIRMSDAEVAALLDEQRTMSVATINADGWPHLVAMWFVVLDGAVHFWTYGRSRKAVNLRRDPRLTCLVETGEAYTELRGVQLVGRATLFEDHDGVSRVAEALFARYTGPVDGAMRDALAGQIPKRVAVRVDPQDTISWDHRKL